MGRLRRLVGLKGLLSLLFETIEAIMSPTERTALEKKFDSLHKGGATVIRSEVCCASLGVWPSGSIHYIASPLQR